MRFIIKLGFLFLFLLPVVSLAQDEQTHYESITCPFEMPSDLTIECGYVTVPENHDEPNGNTIRLAIAILKSDAANPASDPLLFLQGGPGSSAIEFTLLRDLPGAFRAALAERDVVLLDQRGTGLSEPDLGCPEIVAEIEQNPAAMAAGWQALQGALFECRDRLVSDGVDLTAYTTDQNAADVAMVRQALGYEAINLYGISYGTRLALAVVRDYPDGVRSVILDSALPLDVDPVGEEPTYTQAAFTQFFAACGADTTCGLAYPQLEGRFFEVVDHLSQQPVTLTSEGTEVEADISITLDGEQFARIVYQMIGGPMGRALIPGLIYDAHDSDYRMLKNLLFVPIDLRQAHLSSPAAQYSVACADTSSATSIEPSEAIPALFYSLGQFGDGLFISICQQWGDFAKQDNSVAESDIPTLILAGEYDFVTPKLWAERVAADFAQSQLVEIPAAPHALTLLNKACVSAITTTFLQSPEQVLTITCLDELKAEPYMISASASRPVARFAAIGLSGVAVWAGSQVALRGTRRRKQLAWRMSLRLVGWYGLLGSALGIAFLMFSPNDAESFPIAGVLYAVAGIAPLAAGIQAAFIFSPDDEPGLEVLLAAPRPAAWLLLERLAIVLLLHAGVATIGTIASLLLDPDQQLGIAFARWLPTMLFLSGLAAFTTLRSRQPAFGAGVTGLVWFVFGFMGHALLPGQPTFWPLSLVQPFIWPVHLYLQPDALMLSDFWLNRLVVTAVGVGFFMLCVRLMRDEEQLLAGRAQSKAKGTNKETHS